MDFKDLRWASVGAAFALFAVVNLLILLITPGSKGLSALIPPAVSFVVVLLTLPKLVALFERQQDRIEQQRREITTLHAMDTAIVGELELPSMLAVAVRQATRALDAEMGGIALRDTEGAEAYHNVPDALRECFGRLVRDGKAESDFGTVARVPLRQNSRTIGHLAVAKSAPSARFTPADEALLADLAATIVVAVKNAYLLRGARDAERKARHLAEVERALLRERRVAQALQEGLLPTVPERVGAFLFSRRYEAQSSEALVGGDIYDLFPLPGGRWGAVIADVSGKGLVAAQKTAMVKYTLRSYAREHAEPSAVVARLNNALFDEPNLTGFVTLIYGVLSEEDATFTYASAGHETPILHRADGAVETLAPTGVVLGALRDLEYREATVHLFPGDGLLLYTDGLSEARTAAGDFLEVEGLARLLADCRRKESRDIADAVLNAVRAFAGGALSDDAALLWIERAAKDAGT